MHPRPCSCRPPCKCMTVWAGRNVGPRTPSGTGADLDQHGGAGVPGATDRRGRRVAAVWRAGRRRRPSGSAPCRARHTNAHRQAGGRSVGSGCRATARRQVPGQIEPRPVRVLLVTIPTTTTVMIAPMVATTIELMSKGPSIGLLLKRTLARKPPTKRADDAEHDVPDDTETLVTLDEEAGQIPGDRAEDDPRDDAHFVPPSPCRASHPPAGVYVSRNSGSAINVAGPSPRADYARARAA